MYACIFLILVLLKIIINNAEIDEIYIEDQLQPIARILDSFSEPERFL
jgi:hypothetical protein